MKCNRKIVGGLIFSISLIILSLSWVMLNGRDFGLIFTSNLYQLMISIVFLGFFITGFTLHSLLADIKHKIHDVKEKEKNVRDFYLYYQFLHPPDMDN